MANGVQQLVLACACAAAASSARADDLVLRPEPEWSVALQLALGWSHERVAPDAPDGVASGLSLLVRYRRFAAGPLFEAAGGSGHDSAYLGLVAGAVLDPVSWLGIELLAEGGAHWIAIPSDYAGLPSGRAAMPYLGLRAALLPLVHVGGSPWLLGARRAGIGLQACVRTDLSRSSVTTGTPPELGLPPDIVPVGGTSLSVLLVVPLVW